jgi:hypothetical protein
MLWMLWLLVIPVLSTWWFLFALGRAAAKSDPKPSPMSTREPGSGEELSKNSPAIRRRFAAVSWYQRLMAQAGYVGFVAHVRKRRPRRQRVGGVAHH